MQQATNAILRGGTILAPTVSAKTFAEQLAEKINAKLNYVPLEKAAVFLILQKNEEDPSVT